MSEDEPRCVSVIAPVFNEAESLPQLHREIAAAMALVGGDWELILVDDHSSDAGADWMVGLAQSDPHVSTFRLGSKDGRPHGQSAALAAGVDAARGDVIVTLDADLQNDPADIPALLRLLEDYDLVAGVRVDRHDTWRRRAASAIANRVRRLFLGDTFTDIGCSLKAYRAHYLRGVPWFDGMHRFLPVFAQRRGARATEVPVGHRARVHGESKYTIGGRLVRGIRDLLAVRWLLSRSVDVSGAVATPQTHVAGAGSEAEREVVR